jgi:hypothetical protein
VTGQHPIEDVLREFAPQVLAVLVRRYGQRAGLALLGTLDTDERMAHTHRLEAFAHTCSNKSATPPPRNPTCERRR